MVSADNLNLDVLELIFAHLSGNDLSSVALVSSSFFSGVIPRLYRRIMFRLSHAKRYPKRMSAFGAILANPTFAPHVRHIEIRTIPSQKSQHDPTFLSECTKALKLCSNLQSFKCTVNALPPFLAPLQAKERLHTLRVHANITTAQSEKLAEIGNLTTLCLDYGSWNVIDVLPRWTPNFSKTLTSLCLYMASELNEPVLQQVLQQLPGLLGLHIVGCARIDHAAALRLVNHTPLLESLSLSTTESSCPLTKPAPSLPHLKHLSFDTRYSMISSPAPAVLTAVLNHLQPSGSALVSFKIRLPELKIVVGKEFIQLLLKQHANTLRHIAFIDCAVDLDSLTSITRSCTYLERLELPIPMKDIMNFSFAIGRSKSLQTLVDTDSHSAHGPNSSLTHENVHFLMQNTNKLRKVVTGKRLWKATGATASNSNEKAKLQLSLERLPAYPLGSYWFMPRDALD